MIQQFSGLTYFIGTCRSGLQIRIPDKLNIIESFVDTFALQDRVDLFCMTEFHILENHRQMRAHQEAKLTDMLNDILRKQLDDETFALTLRDLGLFTSIDYARFGRDLARTL